MHVDTNENKRISQWHFFVHLDLLSYRKRWNSDTAYCTLQRSPRKKRRQDTRAFLKWYYEGIVFLSSWQTQFNYISESHYVTKNSGFFFTITVIRTALVNLHYNSPHSLYMGLDYLSINLWSTYKNLYNQNNQNTNIKT